MVQHLLYFKKFSLFPYSIRAEVCVGEQRKGGGEGGGVTEYAFKTVKNRSNSSSGLGFLILNQTAFKAII